MPVCSGFFSKESVVKLSVNRACLKPVAYVVGVALAIFQILFTGGFFILEPPLLRGIHLSAIMVLVFLLVPPLKKYKGKEEPIIFIGIDLILCAIAIAIGCYFYVELENLLNRIVYVDEVTNVDLFLGTACILLVLEITRRTTGFPLFCVALAFLLYGLFLPPSDTTASPTTDSSKWNSCSPTVFSAPALPPAQP